MNMEPHATVRVVKLKKQKYPSNHSHSKVYIIHLMFDYNTILLIERHNVKSYSTYPSEIANSEISHR
jgi:hypothetical protein